MSKTYMEIDTVYIPTVMFCRYARLDEDRDVGNKDIILQLHGNPSGQGISSVRYIYCVPQVDLKKRLSDLYHLRIHIKWPQNSKLFDETKRCEGRPSQKSTYEEYLLRGYSGIHRNFEDIKRYVIFEPLKVITEVTDTDSGHTLYTNDLLKGADSGVPFVDIEEVARHFSDPGHRPEQQRLNTIMLEKITPLYIDLRYDYFDVGEIARRRGWQFDKALKNVEKIVSSIEVKKVSGCWYSPQRDSYTKTFWLSKGGLSMWDIFHHPFEFKKNEPTVIKNKHILHAMICELTLGEDHFHCCRPQHLRLGTSRENSVYVKVRKSLQQQFDLTYLEMQEFAFLLGKMAEIVQKQEHIMTESELRVFQRRKGNKTINCHDMATGKVWTTVCGSPDMGDPHGELEEICHNSTGGKGESTADHDEDESDNGNGEQRRNRKSDPCGDGTSTHEEGHYPVDEDRKVDISSGSDSDSDDGVMFEEEEKLRKYYSEKLQRDID